MNITFLEHEDNSINFTDFLKRGECHYVSVAMPGLTFASSYIEFAGNFSVEQRNGFMTTVNRAKETGTLYPKLNLTLLPSPSASYTGFDYTEYNSGDFSTDEVIRHILDAFKANSEYIKSKKMYFDFRYLCVSEWHYGRSLWEAVKRLDKLTLPEIVTWKPE